MQNWNRPRGFSLIEMITTLSVLAALIAVAAPSYVSFQKTALIENAAIKLLSLFEIAQSEALKRNKEIYIQYIPSNRGREGCFALSIDSEINENQCDDDNGMPRFMLKADSKLTVIEPKSNAAMTLFYLSPMTGLPSKNKTIKLTVDSDVEKVSGVLVRRYAGLRGCSDTSITGWETCPTPKLKT